MDAQNVMPVHARTHQQQRLYWRRTWLITDHTGLPAGSRGRLSAAFLGWHDSCQPPPSICSVPKRVESCASSPTIAHAPLRLRRLPRCTLLSGVGGGQVQGYRGPIHKHQGPQTLKLLISRMPLSVFVFEPLRLTPDLCVQPDHRMSLSCNISILYSLFSVVYLKLLSPSVCVPPKLRLLRFALPVYVASRYFQENPPFSLDDKTFNCDDVYYYNCWNKTHPSLLTIFRSLAPSSCVCNTNQRLSLARSEVTVT